MKGYTDIVQSKKLAEILPIESADMYWLNRHIDLTETKYEVFVIDKSNKYIDFFNSYAVAVENKEIIPCWSLAALLSVLEQPCCFQHGKPTWFCGSFGKDKLYHEVEADNLVDACYELILKLNEQKLI